MAEGGQHRLRRLAVYRFAGFAAVSGAGLGYLLPQQLGFQLGQFTCTRSRTKPRSVRSAVIISQASQSGVWGARCRVISAAGDLPVPLFFSCSTWTTPWPTTASRRTTSRSRTRLFAALQGATGAITTSQTTLKRRAESLQFRDQIAADAPPDRELHVILDNDCTRKKCDDWLAQHPYVHVHFTPTSASWLDHVEI